MISWTACPHWPICTKCSLFWIDQTLVRLRCFPRSLHFGPLLSVRKHEDAEQPLLHCSSRESTDNARKDISCSPVPPCHWLILHTRLSLPTVSIIPVKKSLFCLTFRILKARLRRRVLPIVVLFQSLSLPNSRFVFFFIYLTASKIKQTNKQLLLRAKYFSLSSNCYITTCLFW